MQSKRNTCMFAVAKIMEYSPATPASVFELVTKRYKENYESSTCTSLLMGSAIVLV